MGMVCNESDSGSKCKKHPRRRQQPGVCSACLTERLSELSCIRYSSSTNNNSSSLMASSRSSSLSSSSPYSSAGSSPTRRGHFRIVSINEDVGSMSFVMSGIGGGLSKSRSVAFAGNTRFRDVAGRKKKKKKKGGFWSKLFRSTGKRTKQVFGHSRSVKESFDYYL